MNGYRSYKLGLVAAISLGGFALSSCGPRVVISTGTTIGLKATPGDGNTRPPQVTLGYKRAETALVPTAGGKATADADAFSTLAAIYFSTKWFGRTEIHSFVGSGVAAREVQAVAKDKEAPAVPGIERTQGGTQSEFWDKFLGEARRK